MRRGAQASGSPPASSGDTGAALVDRRRGRGGAPADLGAGNEAGTVSRSDLGGGGGSCRGPVAARKLGLRNAGNCEAETGEGRRSGAGAAAAAA